MQLKFSIQQKSFHLTDTIEDEEGWEVVCSGTRSECDKFYEEWTDSRDGLSRRILRSNGQAKKKHATFRGDIYLDAPQTLKCRF